MNPAAGAKQVEALIAEVRKDLVAVGQTVAVGRQVPWFRTETLPVTRLAYGMQERVWVNGAEDVHLLRVFHSTTVRRVDNVGSFLDAIRRYDGNFEFGWNMQVGRNGAMYGGATHVWLSRRSLGHADRGQELTLSRPFLVKAGDTVTLRLKPLLFSGTANWVPSGTTLTSLVFDVNFTLVGYRTGVLA